MLNAFEGATVEGWSVVVSGTAITGEATQSTVFASGAQALEITTSSSAAETDSLENQTGAFTGIHAGSLVLVRLRSSTGANIQGLRAYVRLADLSVAYSGSLIVPTGAFTDFYISVPSGSDITGIGVEFTTNSTTGTQSVYVDDVAVWK
jgi:hypothetical protein